MPSEAEYGGLRLKTTAAIDRARARVVIDVGFGDSTKPGLVKIDLPVLLDQSAPRLRAYPY
jgi:nucleotidyltransferase AbiEii toxin of type IV toxin-antitoxin system